MVADRVEVVSRRVGGREGVALDERREGRVRDHRGRAGGLRHHGDPALNERGKEYADRWRLMEIVRKYSNHIAFPIHLHYDEKGEHGDGWRNRSR